MTVDFDVLSRAAQQQGTREAMDALWGAVYELPQWHFIPRVGEDNNVHPMAAVVQGRPFLLAFTDIGQARKTAEAQGLLGRDGAYYGLALPIESIVESAPAYAQAGVFGILFNNGPHGFFAPLQNIPAMYAHYYPEGRI